MTCGRFLKWHVNVKNDKRRYKLHLQDAFTFLPFALSYLLCFPLHPIVLFGLTPSVPQVMLWFLLVSLPFPSARKASSCFKLRDEWWASGRTDILYPFSPWLCHRDPVTPAYTCAFVLLCLPWSLPCPQWKGEMGTHACGYVRAQSLVFLG